MDSVEQDSIHARIELKKDLDDLTGQVIRMESEEIRATSAIQSQDVIDIHNAISREDEGSSSTTVTQASNYQNMAVLEEYEEVCGDTELLEMHALKVHNTTNERNCCNVELQEKELSENSPTNILVSEVEPEERPQSPDIDQMQDFLSKEPGMTCESTEQLNDTSSIVSDLPWSIIGTQASKRTLHGMQENQVGITGSINEIQTRDSVRELYAHQLGPFPSDTSGKLIRMLPIHRRHIYAALSTQGLSWGPDEQNVRLGITANDLIGATIRHKPHEFVVHYMLPGPGVCDKVLHRRYKTMRFRTANNDDAAHWVKSIQNAVKWLARIPLNMTRRCKVILNPIAGRRKAPLIWQKWEPFFRLANIECDVEETEHLNHAFQIAKYLPKEAGYECIVILGGDGTANEFLNGILARPDAEWRFLVATTPFALMSTGTDNALSIGVGTPTHVASVYAIITRKIRPLDAISIETVPGEPTYSFCGASFGLPGDIAKDSESYRWMGTYRYSFLKLKHIFYGKRHAYRIHYVESTANGTLKTYYELREGAIHDQHLVEQRSLYSPSESKEWIGSLQRPEKSHHTDEGTYIGLGAINVYFDAKYSHPSDGLLDFIAVRRGPWLKLLDAAWNFSRGTTHPLLVYRKVEALDILPQGNEMEWMNIDGEAIRACGLVRLHVIKHLLSVLSEK